MRLPLTALAGLALALPATAETGLTLTLGPIDTVETISYDCDRAAPLRVEFVNAGDNALALTKIDGAMRIFVNVVSGSGARYVSGAETLWTKGRTALLENQMNETKVQCEQTDEGGQH